MFPPQNNGMPPRPPQAAPAMPPRPMAPPPPPQAAPGGGGGDDPRQIAMMLKQKLPPQAAAMIDPNNPLQLQVLQRFMQLSPQDMAALATIDRPAMMVLKKVIPEAYVMLVLNKVGGPGEQGAPMAGPTGMAPDAPPPMPAPGGAPPMPQQMRPQTALGRVG